MASFALQSLFTIEYKVKPLNFDGIVEFISIHEGKVENYSNPNDPRVAGERIVHLKQEFCGIEDNISYILSSAVHSGLEVCTAVAHKINPVSANE